MSVEKTSITVYIDTLFSNVLIPYFAYCITGCFNFFEMCKLNWDKICGVFLKEKGLKFGHSLAQR